MKKKVMISLVGSFIALISGLILCGIGLFTGGVTDIIEIATPPLITESYEDIDKILLDFQSNTVTIEQSPDDQFHVRYVGLARHGFQPFTLTYEDKTLSLEYEKNTWNFPGIMHFLGRELAIHAEPEMTTITILVPKNQVIEEITGGNYYSLLNLQNIQVKNLYWNGQVFAENVKMTGGEIAISDSPHQRSDFTNSHLKDMTISSDTIQYSFFTSTLDNVTFDEVGLVEFYDTTFLGTTKLNTSSSLIHHTLPIYLSDKSQTDTQIHLTVTYDLESLKEYYMTQYNPYHFSYEEDDDQIEKDIRQTLLPEIGIEIDKNDTETKIEESKEKVTATRTPKEAANQLIVTTTNNNIILGLENDE